jgi:hypothetical protein
LFKPIWVWISNTWKALTSDMGQGCMYQNTHQAENECTDYI